MMSVNKGRALFLAATLVGQPAGFAYAAPTCKRVASQWAVVFSAKCTQWFEHAGHAQGSAPGSCTQEFTGAVVVENFPWNDAVVIVDSETPGDSISLQPEEDVVQYGAGIVIMQTSWDMDKERMWQARTSSSAERVYAEVEYIASDEKNYLDFDLSVRYKPDGSQNSSATRKLSGTSTTEVDETELEEFIEDVFGVPSMAEDENGEDDTYHPTYVYSYEQESYDFSYGFELEELDSYSYDFVDGTPEEGEGSPIHSYSFSYSFGYGDYSYHLEEEAEVEPIPPNAVQSVTSVDIYVCTDEENNLAELRFNCDPNNNGTAQCFTEAGDANVEALEIHGMDMMCDNVCLDGQAGGLWCDIFGLNGCRLCTDDCTSICNGELACSSCIFCDGHPSAPSPAVTAAPSPSSTSAASGTPSPTRSRDIPSTPTTGPTGYETPAPTYIDPGLPSASPTIGGLEPDTASPISGPDDGNSGLPSGSPSPTPGSTGYDTPSPTSTDGGFPFPSASPTAGSSRGFGMETASPTSGSHGGFPMMSAAPTSGFSECRPGDPETCYNQLEPFMRGRLEGRNRGLTCEESCLVRGGLWCNALGLNGCRFCATSCDNFCAAQGLSDDCDCFEC